VVVAGWLGYGFLTLCVCAAAPWVNARKGCETQLVVNGEHWKGSEGEAVTGPMSHPRGGKSLMSMGSLYLAISGELSFDHGLPSEREPLAPDVTWRMQSNARGARSAHSLVCHVVGGPRTLLR
jgi:hypothetical protein